MYESPTFIDDHHLRVGDCDFYCRVPMIDVPPGHLPVLKPRAMVEHHLELLGRLRPRRVVELGIHSGGSTALLHQVLRPEKLVAVDLKDREVQALSNYITEHAAGDVVRPYYGVDQADRARLTGIVATEFGGQPIDLVIDDASHLFAETRASFEVLFPHLAPGGLYLIEDWSGELRMRDVIAAGLRKLPNEEVEELLAGIIPTDQVRDRERPLVELVIELLLVSASRPDLVRRLTARTGVVTVERGDVALDPRAFHMDDQYEDHFDLLGEH